MLIAVNIFRVSMLYDIYSCIFMYRNINSIFVKCILLKRCARPKLWPIPPKIIFFMFLQIITYPVFSLAKNILKKCCHSRYSIEMAWCRHIYHHRKLQQILESIKRSFYVKYRLKLFFEVQFLLSRRRLEKKENKVKKVMLMVS